MFFLQQRIADGKKIKNSPLWNSVKGLKSWGCSFFAPVVEGSLTIFYDESNSELGTFPGVKATEEGLLLEEDNEDVFDPTMDFGMSLLKDGKILVKKSTPSKPERDEHNNPVTPERSAVLSPGVGSISSTPAGHILMQHMTPSQQSVTDGVLLSVRHDTSAQFKSSLDSDYVSSAQSTSSIELNKAGSSIEALANKTNARADEERDSESVQATNLFRSGAKRSPASSVQSGTSSVDVDSNKGLQIDGTKTADAMSTQNEKPLGSVDRFRELPGSPEKFPRNASLSTSLNDVRKKSIAFTSDDTNIFLSAESELHLSSPKSSSGSSEDFFSAESDVDNFPKVLKPVASFPELDGTEPPENLLRKEETQLRPENLDLLVTRNVVRKLDLTTENLPKSTTSLDTNFRRASLKEPRSSVIEITSYYSYILATTKFKDSDWLSDFEVIEDGVHPSVVVEKENRERSQKRTDEEVFSKLPGENCTKVILHIKVSMRKTSIFVVCPALIKKNMR